MSKLFDGIILGVYIVISVLAIALSIAGAIFEPNTDDSALSNDPEVVEVPSESLQSPILEPEIKEIVDIPKPEAQNVEEEVTEESVKEPATTVLDGVLITHYCACSKCCGAYANGITATGKIATAGHTIAVDPEVIPFGSEVVINGQHYIAEDSGPSGKHIDIFVDDHQEALNLGMYTTSVEVIY